MSETTVVPSAVLDAWFGAFMSVLTEEERATVAGVIERMEQARRDERMSAAVKSLHEAMRGHQPPQRDLTVADEYGFAVFRDTNGSAVASMPVEDYWRVVKLLERRK